MDPTGQSDEDSYKALTALGILSAIQSLVKATFNETDVCVCVCCLYVEGGADRVVMYVYSHQAGKSEAGGTDNRMLLFSYITSPSKRA